MATVTGVPTNVNTSPRSVSVNGVPYAEPIDDKHWDLILLAWAATPKREVTLTDNDGTPKQITNVMGA